MNVRVTNKSGNDYQTMMKPRVLHQFSRDELDLRKELDVLRESTKHALQQAWGENTEKEDRIMALERQVQDLAKRESNYKQQLGDASKQTRRGSGQSMTRSASVSRVTSDRDRPRRTSNSSSGLLDKFLDQPTKQRRPSGSGSVAGWSVGTELRDYISGKKGTGSTISRQEMAHHLATMEKQKRMEIHEMEMKLQNRDMVVKNLEQANHKHQQTVRSLQLELEQANLKHQQTVLSLQLELEKVKQTAFERERVLQRKIEAKREEVAQKVKDLQHYQNYVGDLTKELEKVYGKGNRRPSSSSATTSSQKSMRSSGSSADRSHKTVASTLS